MVGVATAGASGRAAGVGEDPVGRERAVGQLRRRSLLAPVSTIAAQRKSRLRSDVP